MNDSFLQVAIGFVIGFLALAGIIYLMILTSRRQAKMVEQYVGKYNLKLSESGSAFLISKKLVIFFDESEIIISRLKQASPERISYQDVELVRVEWQKVAEMHRMTIKLRSGELQQHRIMQAYHNSFSGQPAKKNKEAVIVTDYINEQLIKAGVTVEIIK